MSVLKKFTSFLEMMGVNYNDYAECALTDTNGNKYLFSQINDEKIKNFDWAYFLAQKNQLILLNNNQDTMESIERVERYRNGSFNKAGEYYKEDIKKYDAERFEYAKDMYYLIRDICGKIEREFGQVCPMYIEDGSADNFLIFTCDKKTNISKIMKAAKKLGLYVFRIDWSFPKRVVKPLSHKDCTADGILIPKYSYKKDRNDELIAELKDKRREKRTKQMSFVMSQADDVKFTQKAKKLYDEIKVYGLEGLSKDNPQLNTESFLTDVFKTLLYKKWVAYKDIVELEIDHGYFFHMYDDRNVPLKQDLIFDIIDTIEENE